MKHLLWLTLLAGCAHRDPIAAAKYDLGRGLQECLRAPMVRGDFFRQIGCHKEYAGKCVEDGLEPSCAADQLYTGP
jgi:hypothetical protein